MKKLLILLLLVPSLSWGDKVELLETKAITCYHNEEFKNKFTKFKFLDEEFTIPFEKLSMIFLFEKNRKVTIKQSFLDRLDETFFKDAYVDISVAKYILKDEYIEIWNGNYESFRINRVNLDIINPNSSFLLGKNCEITGDDTLENFNESTAKLKKIISAKKKEIGDRLYKIK